MSTSQMSDEEALEAAWDAGYEEGAADALVDELNSEDQAEAQTAGDEYTVAQMWLEQQRKSGINVLEWFQVRWDAAERRVVVEQKKQEEEVDLDAFYAEEKESHCGDA